MAAVIDMTNIADNIHCLGLRNPQNVGLICLHLQVEGGGLSTYYGGTVKKAKGQPETMGSVQNTSRNYYGTQSSRSSDVVGAMLGKPL